MVSNFVILFKASTVDLFHDLELAQFPVTMLGGGDDPQSGPPSAFIRLVQGVVGTIWLDLGALNQGYHDFDLFIFPVFV